MLNTTKTNGSATSGFDQRKYRNLLVKFEPRPITTDAEMDRAQEIIDELVGRQTLTPEEQTILDLVTTLVEQWEQVTVSIPASEPREIIRFLLEAGARRQKELIPIFGNESVVSEVLSGKRDLQFKHISGLSSFFHVSPAVFFGNPDELGVTSEEHLREKSPAHP